MKDAIDSMPTERPPEQEGFANRKLIRPSLNRNDHNHGHAAAPPERRERSAGAATAAPGRKAAPPETTNAENFYYQKQMQGKTPMVIVLRDGEQIHGVIEWYDKTCLKVNRDGEPNLLIYKPAIKYMYKEGEGK
jgi:sRNA-binding regulator protein Hfq